MSQEAVPKGGHVSSCMLSEYCSSPINILKCLLVQLVTKLSDSRSFLGNMTLLVAGFIICEGHIVQVQWFATLSITHLKLSISRHRSVELLSENCIRINSWTS